MNITYNYRVCRVDATSKTMEVEYQSEGRQPLIMGMPMPSVDQSLTELIKSYAPISFWAMQERQVQAVEENTAGVVELGQPAAPTQEQILQQMIAAVQLYIDTPARAWGYDDAKTAVTYLGDPNPQFAAEAVAIRDFRSACWVRAWELRDEVLGGTRAVPTQEQLYAELPVAPVRPQA